DLAARVAQRMDRVARFEAQQAVDDIVLGSLCTAHVFNVPSMRAFAAWGSCRSLRMGGDGRDGRLAPFIAGEFGLGISLQGLEMPGHVFFKKQREQVAREALGAVAD